MQVEMSLDHLRGLCGLAAVGKLMNGLVHNLNGPLQNLGMELEMMIYSLPENGSPQEGITKGMRTRLRRMEEELDRINDLVRATSMNAVGIHEPLGSMGLHEFIEREWYFLDANLYFKHKVQKQHDLADDLPLTDSLGDDVCLSLKWIMQALAEEMEKGKFGRLTLTARVAKGRIKLVFDVEGGELSDSFTRTVNRPVSDSGTLKIEDHDVALTLALALLTASGATVAVRKGPTGTEVVLDLPVPVEGTSGI